MNTEPPTGDDLTRMLVSMKKNVLERATDTTRRRPGRRFGIAFGLVALIGLGSAGGAVAMGFVPSPFEGLAQPEPTAVVSTPPAPTPTATPTPEPSAAPSTQPVGGTPEPYLPIDCATLATESSLTSLLRAPELKQEEGLVFTPREASLRQSGVQTCAWMSSSEADYAGFDVDISLDDPASVDALAAKREGGTGVELGLGDDSALACGASFRCAATVVVGDYWIEAEYEQSQDFGDDTTDLVVAQLGRIADVVRPLEARAPWVASAASQRWVATGDCSTLDLVTPLGTIFADPSLDESWFESTPDGRNPLVAEASDEYGCQSEGTTRAEDGQPIYTSVQVHVAAGARWGYERFREYAVAGLGASDGFTTMTVQGAEDGLLQCAEMSSVCYLDVLVDDSWMRVIYEGPGSASQAPRLVQVAESIIAAR
ncbi:hypothetical protein [Frigoribacterium sp. Leaf172]|uniref:hypothetical protein n=1 Tax=Frigoribacterium sp. Leaf172 TaxID=1736285 RepID=UPI000A427954|nr:hypothetical protein [Frigoribacterium sp. Leaf172]